jgi:hypothetical protein
MRTALATLCLAALGVSPAALADEGLSVRGHVELLAAVRGLLPTDSAANPGNAALRLPQLTGSAELRPSLTVDYGGWLTLVARPRLLGSLEGASVDGRWDPARGAASASLTELFVTWRLNDNLAFTWGLQNFQWGPAELLSPSNRLFHEVGLTRDPLYLVPGKHLVRVNASVGKAFSAVLLVELSSNGHPEFAAGEAFAPRVVGKVEYAAESGRWLVGLTGTASTAGWPSLGEYAQVQLTDGLSAYLDASHGAWRGAWYPGVAGFEHRTSVPEHLFTTALGGLRYTFQSGVDVRAEYLFNEQGWTEGELVRASQLAREPSQQPAWLAPGLEFLSRHLAYASLRLPDLPPGKRLAVQLRYLLSLTDHSGAGFLTASFDATDALVVFLSLYAAHGDSAGELTRLARGAAVLGASYTW